MSLVSISLFKSKLLKRVKKPVLFQFQPFYSGCWIPKKSEEVSIPISQVDKYLLQTIFL